MKREALAVLSVFALIVLVLSSEGLPDFVSSDSLGLRGRAIILLSYKSWMCLFAEEPAVLKAQDPEVSEGEEVGLLEATRNVPQFLREALVTRKKRWHLFGVEMSPDTIAIAMVYFVQGILGLARLAVSYFLKDDLHLDPAEVNLQMH